MRGTVRDFDVDRCLGVIVDDSGVERPFHGVTIADGTRAIGVGSHVEFDLLPKLGRFEASNIRSV